MFSECGNIYPAQLILRTDYLEYAINSGKKQNVFIAYFLCALERKEDERFIISHLEGNQHFYPLFSRKGHSFTFH